MKIYNLVCKFMRKYPRTIASRLMSHAKVIESIIDKDEQIVFAFCGQKNDTIKMIFDTCILVGTNKRLIIGQKRILWGYNIINVTPDMFNDLKIYSGLYWGKIEIDTVKEVIYISNIDKRSLDEIETGINNLMINMKGKKKDVQ